MEKKVKKGRGLRVFIALGVMCMLLMGLAVQAGAADSEPASGNLTMTLTVTENGKQVPMAQVPLALYQVGTMDTQPVVQFHLEPSLSATGVDLNNLRTAADSQKAAAALSQAVASAGVVSYTASTDANGQVSFQDLPKGVYLLVQTGGTEICTVSAMLLSVPYSADGKTLEYDVKAFPKADRKVEKSRLTVTKKLCTLDKDLNEKPISAPDATFYVRLFQDEAATVPYGEVKAIRIQGQSSGTVDFTDLPEGTYYIRETDAEGNPRPVGDAFEDENGKEVSCFIAVNGTDGTALNFTNAYKDQAVVVDNVYTDLPDGFYLERNLWIQKNVIKDGQQITTDDTFYATVKEVDPDTGEETTVITTELTQNDRVAVNFQILDKEELEKVHTYRVYESDEEGNPVDKSTFGFEVGGEGNVVFQPADDEKTITITNTVISTTPTPTPAPSTTPGSDTPGSSSGGISGSSPVKTGDSTPVGLFIGLFAAAAVITGAVVYLKRRKK